MQLWTLIEEETWDTLQSAGFLYANPKHYLEDTEWFRDMCEAYDWMRYQMHQRIPGYGGHYPWWAWHTTNGARRVDLRDRSFFHWGKEKVRVRLELDVPDEEVLLSDYDHWHAVLNGTNAYRKYQAHHAIPLSVREERGMEKLFRTMTKQEQISFCSKNWERIFLLEYPKRRDMTNGWGWGPCGKSQNIQACFEMLRLNTVRRVTYFKNRPIR